jgi:ferrous iron transport protein A
MLYIPAEPPLRGGQVIGIFESRIPPNPGLQSQAIWPYTELRPFRSYFQAGRLGGQRCGVRQVSLLSDLAVGECGVLVALDLPESVQNHLMHMGFVPDAEVTALRRAPAGDPTVYRVDGLEIALRHETASAIRMRPVDVHPIDTVKPASTLPDQAEEAPTLVEAAR